MSLKSANVENTLGQLTEGHSELVKLPLEKSYNARVPQVEERDVLVEFNGKTRPDPENKLIHQLFEEQVQRTPEAIAVEHGHRRLTYGQLNRRANQLARYLLSQQVGPDRAVGICVERGVEMAVGLLAIMKAGGAYLPLDPNYPQERLQQMLDDAAPRVVLSETALLEILPAGKAKVVPLDETLEQVAAFADEDLPANEVGLTSENLVYLIYTSGSTGRPKGTAMRHRSVVNLIEWHRDTFGSGEGRRVLQFASLSFDVAFQEVFSTICTGATVVLLDEWIRRDAKALIEFLCNQSIHRLFVPPLMLQSIAEHCKSADQVPLSLEDVITAGEQLRVSTEVRQLFSRLEGCRLHNHYGPTESHVVTALALQGHPGQWPELPPIGHPIANTRIYLLDGQMQPVPLGAAGEIYIGGAGVARGYLNRPELTSERFLSDPFSPHPGARMYRTGDLARYLPDGNLVFLGRNDQQVKIRGFRIEPGEIEAHLSAHPAVREAVVIAREDSPGEKRLVAYLTGAAESALPPEQLAPTLRAHLSARLPEYMLPAAFVQLDALPLTPNGKLDRGALPAPDQSAYAGREYEVPRGEVEEILAGIWQELLKVKRVGRRDNFFELGGHSLLIVQMMERLRRVGLSAEVRRVFESPTLSDLAGTLIQGTQGIEVPPNLIPARCDRITPEMLPLIELEQEHIDRIAEAVPGGTANIQDLYALSPLQDGILFHHLLASEGDPYLLINQMAFPHRALLDRYLAAMQHVIDRHDILRTAFFWEQLSRPAQAVLRQAPLSVSEVTLDPEDGPALEQLARRFDPRRHRIELTQAPLLRFIIAQEPGSERWLIVQLLHHLIGDHSTLEIIHAEVQSILKGQAHALCAPQPFRNLIAQARLGVSPQEHERFFRKMLADIDEPTAPFGLSDVYREGHEVTEAHRMLPEGLNAQLRAHARRLGVSLASLCHLAWGQVIARTSGRTSVVFGTVLFGRMHAGEGADQAMGLFINTLPLRLDLDESAVEDSVRHTHARLAELLRHEHASLALAQRCSGVAAAAPLFSALLNYRHNQPAFSAEESSPADDPLREVQWFGAKERTNYPLTLSVEDFGQALGLTAQVISPLSPERICGYMQQALEQLSHALSDHPVMPVRQLKVIPPEERTLLLEQWNKTDAPYPQELCIQQLFEQQVERSPEATALIFERLSLSYCELNAQANRLAHHLIALGVRPDEPVAICLERSPALIISLLAILKAGGAYVPLDPAYPSERLTQILCDAAPRILLSDQSGRRALGAHALEGLSVLDLDGSTHTWASLPESNPDPSSLGLTSSYLAYIIYTSGSTGTPKGVMVPHLAVNRLVINNGYCPFDASDRVAFASNPAFDASTLEVWGALLNGGGLVVVDQKTLLAPDAFVQLLQAFQVTRLWLTVGLFNQISAAIAPVIPQLKSLIIGGDVLDPSVIAQVLQESPPKQLLNGYGPTETTTFAATYTIHEARADVPIPLGRPIANTRIYLLDGQMQPVPLGATGEIYIGGAGVARGYLNRPELTSERFLTDPFSPHPQARTRSAPAGPRARARSLRFAVELPSASSAPVR